MIENEELMASSENEDDVPVAFCICRNGAYIDWKEVLPEEVLYVPESIFEKIAPGFMERLGSDYYGTNGVAGKIEELLETELALPSENLILQQSKIAISQFLEKARSIGGSHYLVFEGP